MFLSWWRSQVTNSLHNALDIAPCTFCYKRDEPKHIRVSISMVRTLSDCVRVLHMCTAAMCKRDRVTSADMLADFVFDMFTHRAPTEHELQMLSILQQEAEGTKGMKEYAVNLLWSCALACVLEREDNKRKKLTYETTCVAKHDPMPLARSWPQICENTLDFSRTSTF